MFQAVAPFIGWVFNSGSPFEGHPPAVYSGISKFKFTFSMLLLIV